MFDFIKHSNIWKIADQVHHTPGFIYVEVMVTIVGASVYIQRKQKLAGGDGKFVRTITYIVLGAILVEGFMRILHRSAAILL